jgi:hypothetical protein
MRIILTSFAMLMLGIGDLAAQNILLPGNKDSSTTPATTNLGIAPKKTAPAPTDVPTPIQPPLQPQVAQPAPAFEQTITPGGQLAPSANAGPANLGETEIRAMMRQAGITDDATNITPEQQQRLQQLIAAQTQQLYQRPPMLIDEPQIPEPPEAYLSALPNSLAIAVSPKYVWGTSDVDSVQASLGYAPQQIPANCQLRIDTQLLSERDMTMRNVYSGQQTILRYSGTPKSINLIPKAVCNTPAQLPQSGRPIIRNGKMLIVILTGIASCQVPPAAAKSLEIQYFGDGKVNCNYR